MICAIVHLPWQYGDIEPRYATNMSWSTHDQPPWVPDASVGRAVQLPNTGMLKFKVLEMVDGVMIEHLAITPSEQIQKFLVDKPLICQEITMIPLSRKQVLMTPDIVPFYASNMIAYTNSIELLFQSQMTGQYTSPTSLAYFLALAKQHNVPCPATDNFHVTTLNGLAETGVTPLDPTVSQLLAATKSVTELPTTLEVLTQAINSQKYFTCMPPHWLGFDAPTSAICIQALHQFVVQSETLVHHLHPNYSSWTLGVELSISEYQTMTPTVESIHLGQTHCNYGNGFGLCLDELLVSQFEYIDMTFNLNQSDEVKVKQSIMDQHSPAVPICEVDEVGRFYTEQTEKSTALRIVQIVNSLFGQIIEGRVVKTPLEEVYMYFNIQGQSNPYHLYFDLTLHVLACGAIPNKTDFNTEPNV